MTTDQQVPQNSPEQPNQESNNPVDAAAQAVENDVSVEEQVEQELTQDDQEVVDVVALKQALEEERDRAEENWQKVLRIQAEMDNLRKRSERDVENAHKFGVEKFAKELLSVADSLEMGLQAAGGDDASVEKIREGTELTLQMLKKGLEKFSVLEVDPIDQPFDPEKHQAVSMQPVEGKASNTVTAVLQKGYTLNSRLIRPAMVMVSKAAAGSVNEQA